MPGVPVTAIARTFERLPLPARRAIVIVLRLAVAAVFVGAAIPKLTDPSSFAEDVANYRMLPDALVGPVAVNNQHRWNQHHAERLLAAAARHPGQRIVMLVGIESRYEVMRLLADAPGIELVDVADWPAAKP